MKYHIDASLLAAEDPSHGSCTESEKKWVARVAIDGLHVGSVGLNCAGNGTRAVIEQVEIKEPGGLMSQHMLTFGKIVATGAWHINLQRRFVNRSA